MTGSLRVADRAAVPSPCTDVCRIDAASGWCDGCMRTLDEIATWGSLDDDDKRAVWRQLPVRRAERASAAGNSASANSPAASASSGPSP